MTTEIAILNTTAVVLGADSALTVDNNGKRIYYHGVNKIFGLSTWHPVAIMIHGSPDFLRVPWEVLIKGFRDYINGDKYDTLEEYCGKFFIFLELFLQKHEIPSAPESIYRKFCHDLTKVIVEAIRDVAAKDLGKHPSKEEMERYFAEKTSEFVTRLEAVADKTPPDAEIERREKLIAPVERMAADAISVWYLNRPLDPHVVARMVVVYKRLCARGLAFQEKSNLVIAGYGEAEYFPGVVSYEVAGYAFGHVMKNERHKTNIGVEQTAAIVPFGDNEIVNSFLHGVSSKFRTEFGSRVREAYSSLYPKKEISRRIDFDAIANDVQKKWDDRIVAALTPLPRRVLADIAENLIRLSAIRSNVYDGEGGTGVPVSIAVISKGDGLVWIQRQNYFDPALNPHYLNRYQKSWSDGDAQSNSGLKGRKDNA